MDPKLKAFLDSLRAKGLNDAQLANLSTFTKSKKAWNSELSRNIKSVGERAAAAQGGYPPKKKPVINTDKIGQSIQNKVGSSPLTGGSSRSTMDQKAAEQRRAASIRRRMNRNRRKTSTSPKAFVPGVGG